MAAATLTPLAAGLVAARLGLQLPAWSIDVLLHVLVVLAGFEIGYTLASNPGTLARASVKGALFAAIVIVAGAAAGAALSPLSGIPVCMSAAVGAASGWYSLAAPVLATAGSREAALVALVANMLREQLHIVLYPFLARRGLRLAAVALGGATTMDTGLPVVVAAGGEEAVAAAVSQGVLLTAVLPAVLPLIASAC
jgi:uncharacterized membrane protein YbjE (DUF340 family)